MKKEKSYGFLAGLIFFLNVFVALLIITGSWILVETPFGKIAMIFGFCLVGLSIVMKAFREW